MKALTYLGHGKFALTKKPKPEILDPRAVPGITVGHEMVGVVESIGSAVSTVQPGHR